MSSPKHSCGETPPDQSDEFRALLIAPFSTHRWASKQGRSHWVDLEGWQDSIAGPLGATCETGGCEYVYSRNDDFIRAVSTPPLLRWWFLARLDGLSRGVERFRPATNRQHTDLAYMRELVERMRDLVEWALAVEQVRWLETHPEGVGP